MIWILLVLQAIVSLAACLLAGRDALSTGQAQGIILIAYGVVVIAIALT